MLEVKCVNPEKTFKRYARQLALPDFGMEDQKTLLNARVLIVGMGALGCVIAKYLSGAGVGTLGLMDDDIVSKSNLHRQILYTEKDIGMLKIEAAKAWLGAQNRDVKINIYNRRFDFETGRVLINDYDVVVSSVDNFPGRYALSDACLMQNKPLVHGSVHQYEGEAGMFNLNSSSPCYRCTYPLPSIDIQNCSEAGVLGPVAGMVGCLQSMLVLDILTKESLESKLMRFDLKTFDLKTFQLQRTSDCACYSNDEVINIQVAYMDVAELESALSKNPNSYQLIDVRTESKNLPEALKQANHMPLKDIEQLASSLDQGLPTVTFCDRGRKSYFAACLLKKLGFKYVYFSRAIYRNPN